MEPASLQRGSEGKIIGNWIKAVLWARKGLPHFIKNLLWSYSVTFCFVMARRWEDGGSYESTRLHCRLSPRAALSLLCVWCSKDTHGLLQGGKYPTVFGGADILLITVHATE